MARYELSKGSVLELLRERGVKIRNQPLSEAQAREVVSLYESGCSMARILQMLGRQHAVVRDAVVRADVKQRDTHGRDR